MTEKKIHYLKCETPYFDMVESGLKTFEVRVNDRGFKSGDYLHLKEFNPQNNKETGRVVECFVPYIFYGGAFGLPSELCVMSLEIQQKESE